jgi:hypothetical protein
VVPFSIRGAPRIETASNRLDVSRPANWARRHRPIRGPDGVFIVGRAERGPVFRPGLAYRVVPTRANGQPAFGLYLADHHASVYRAYGLQVITTAGDHITAITCFNTDVMTRFRLPRTLPETD